MEIILGIFPVWIIAPLLFYLCSRILTTTDFSNLQIDLYMHDWSDLQKRARSDVEAGLAAWISVLKEELDSRIKYAYTKGSATKKWDSPIDYVPTISDVDIHIMLADDDLLLSGSSESFEESMYLSKRYEEEFLCLQSDHLHVPRSQIMTINRLSTVVEYVPPRPQDIRALVGEMPEHKIQDSAEIRRIDRQKLMDYHEYLERLPNRILDRTGLDYWFIIRELCWRVSPAPVRLLTQIKDDPLELWSWNRTSIEKELRANEFDDIADYYRAFYHQGWDLFLSEFKSSEAYRNCITAGYYTLVKCREAVQKND
jgi:hypothetical protein